MALNVEIKNDTKRFMRLSAVRKPDTTVISLYVFVQYNRLCRYFEANVQTLSSVGQYDEDIPLWLRSRPRQFVDHCKARLPVRSGITRQDVVELPNSVYHVFSGDRYKVVCLSSDDANVLVPSCSCPDWRRSNFPCKHLLAVITLCELVSWETLPTHYRLCPLFGIDLPDHFSAADRSLGPIPEEVSGAHTEAVLLASNRSQHCETAETLSHDASICDDDALKDNSSEPHLSEHQSDDGILQGLKLQVRDYLRLLNNTSYNNDSVEDLRYMVSVLKDLVSRFGCSKRKSSVSSFPLRSRRRVAHRPVIRTSLIRRLQLIRAKKRNLKKKRLLTKCKQH